MIINNEKAFPKIVKFLENNFENVRVVKNESYHLAKLSQNFYIIILFKNRGVEYSIKWNYWYCTLYFGDITKNSKTSFQYTFTKMKLDDCYPIEEMNNFNVVFWSFEIINEFDDMGSEISPLRLPITKNRA